jgi:hypothetical protein
MKNRMAEHEFRYFGVLGIQVQVVFRRKPIGTENLVGQ